MDTHVTVTQKNLHLIEKNVPVDVFLRIKEIMLLNDRYNIDTEIILGDFDLDNAEYITRLPSGYTEALWLKDNESGIVFFFKDKANERSC